MLWVDNWFPLALFTSRAFRITSVDVTLKDSLNYKNLTPEEKRRCCAKFHAKKIWEALESFKHVRILSSDGTLINASTRVFSWFDPENYKGYFVDLRIGTLGSGDETACLPSTQSFDDLDLTYTHPGFPYFDFLAIEKFIGLPILLPEKDCISAFRIMANRPEKGDEAPSHKEIAAKIIEEFDKGHVITNRLLK